MRLIDADKVESIFKGACKTGYFDNKPKEKNGASALMDCIRELDTIDPESLRGHAWWKHVDGGSLFNCSNCHVQTNSEQFKSNLHYCPNCGAKMDLEVR